MNRYPEQEAAQRLQSYGRYGDDVLVHLNPAEVRGIAALSPTGKLTTNPVTGQPEAFLPMLIPLLAAYGGSAMAGAAGAGILGSAIASGVASGAATAAVTGDLKRGLVTGVMGAGLGAAAGAAGTNAAAAAEKLAAEQAAQAATSGLTNMSPALTGVADTAATAVSTSTAAIGWHHSDLLQRLFQPLVLVSNST